MSSEPKAAAAPSSAPVARREKGVRIFTYPKFIFIFPTLVMAIICGIGMWTIGDDTIRPSRKMVVQGMVEVKTTTESTPKDDIRDFRSPQNTLAMLFLGVFALNILILTFDFPRFTVLAGILLGTTILFFLLWLTLQFDWFHPLLRMFNHLYLVANANFYLVFAAILLVTYGIILVTRWLDYWEFMPNEILHHHGPWSDLERFPTLNLKFDKEIPDVFEHMLFGAGRLVFHVQNEQKSIMLDNVLWINRKEEALKQIMSRLEVRVTTDQEVAQP
jgi:hypothetical protein